MFLKKKWGKSKDEVKPDTEEKHVALCPNCVQLISQIADVKKQLAALDVCTTKRFSIAPTLYTYYHNNVIQQRISRAASQLSQDILDQTPQPDEDIYNEEIIKNATPDLPIEYFSTPDFANLFIQQCSRIREILIKEPRVLRLKSPIYIFGDFHGNMSDLMSFAKVLWPLGMHLTPGCFLFLGDYVDRGPYSLEVLTYLFAQKILLPEKVFLLRGNHELKAVNGWESFYGTKCFLGQLKQRFGAVTGKLMWNAANSVFDCLPFAAVVDDVIFCVHGGIPRPINENQPASLEYINNIPCPISIRPATSGETLEIKQVTNDLLWADPAQANQESMLDDDGFGEGERGPGAICFGAKAVNDFLEDNGLTHVIRAHEPTQQGVAISKGAKLITIFSTSRDHGCENAFCGCLLVDRTNIIAINHPDASIPHRYSYDETMDLLS
ncbi:hypothetical protein WA158_004283 [Blastocystis sp. Blastoise]